MEDNENEVSLIDSAIMSDSGVHSTPVSTKDSSRSNDEMMDKLQLLLDRNFNELRGR